MKKIAFISHSSLITGAPICLAELVGELLSQPGHPEFHFGLPVPGKLLEKYDLSGANPFFFAEGLGGREITVTKDRIAKRLEKLFAREKFDLVVANTLESFQAVRAATAANIPSIWMVHELLDIYRERRELGALQEAARHANRIIFNSETARRQLPILGEGLEEKARVVYNGIKLPTDDEIKQDCRHQLGFGPDEILLGSIGDICPYKGYETLLSAFASIAPAFPEAKLVIVGRVPPKFREFHSRLEEMVEKPDLKGRVIFPGEVIDPRPWLSSFNILIHPSRRESFGRVIVEGLAWGKPVAATRSGGGEEIIEDNKTGFLVPVDDPESLARTVSRLLEGPEEAAMMGERGREMVGERFPLSRTADEVRQEIERLRPAEEGKG